MRPEIPPVVKRKKVRIARSNGLITGVQILTIAASIDCPANFMRPDMQPENSQDGAGAPDLQPEFESSAATALPADRITSFIPILDGGSDEIWENDIVQVKLSESRLASILEETPDFVGIADVEGRLLFVNAAGRKIIGLEPTEALSSLKIFDCHPEWACRIISQEGIPTALQNGFWSGETAALSQDGVDIPVSQVIVAHRNDMGRVEYLST